MARRPLTATIWSPGRSAPCAGAPFSIAPTEALVSTVWIEGLRLSSVEAPVRLPDARIAQKIANAISRFTPGPARITAMRFHGAWL